MGADTKIQWTTHTFNPWRGCAKVSPGCANCYAETLSHRNPAVLGVWGSNGTRVVASESYWKQPIRWDRLAECIGVRHRVFCASLADVFEDRPDLVEPRERLWRLIRATPHLDWLLLTKRPENWRRCWPLVPVTGHVGQNEGDGKDWETFPNVWMGTSVEDQHRADERIPALLEIPAAVRFLSVEPLLAPIDLRKGIYLMPDPIRPRWRGTSLEKGIGGGIDWVIVGGESGPGARPCDLAWIRSIRDQCRAAGVAVFVKQLGSRPVADFGDATVDFRDGKGGDMEEWPVNLRIREFPGGGS